MKSERVDQLLNGTVVLCEDFGSHHRRLRIALDPGTSLSFRPGQWTDLGVAREPEELARIDDASDPLWYGLARRPYSIASAPEDSEIELWIKRVDHGELTPRLWRGRTGDRLYVCPSPRGSFTLSTDRGARDLLLIATGTGVAPFLSMLRHGEQPWRRCGLLLGAQSLLVHAHHEELLRRSTADPRLDYVPVLSREPRDSRWSGLRGRVTDVIGELEKHADLEVTPEGCDVYLCGSEPMILTCEEQLALRGFPAHWEQPDGAVRAEVFW